MKTIITEVSEAAFQEFEHGNYDPVFEEVLTQLLDTIRKRDQSKRYDRPKDYCVTIMDSTRRVKHRLVLFDVQSGEEIYSRLEELESQNLLDLEEEETLITFNLSIRPIDWFELRQERSYQLF